MLYDGLGETGKCERNVRTKNDKESQTVCDSGHILARCYELLPSGKRYRVPEIRTKRARDTIIPQSINCLSAKNGRRM